jgi:pimeloyl-ACP methyl ester carboxylesterase
VLLAGLGNTAHVFDDFAIKLTRDHHVYGITRRGFGASSMPTARFGPDRLGDDVLAVLDALAIERPVLAGHSIGGMELSSIATRHPERVAGLIYLDAGYSYAFDDGRPPPDVKEPDVEQPQVPGPTPADVASYAALRAWQERIYGYGFPEAEMRATSQPRADGLPGAPRSSAWMEAMFAGFEKYTAIRVPILAIFAAPPHIYGPELSDSQDADMRARVEAWTKVAQEINGARVRAFAEGLPQARVVSLADARHYLFITNESDVLREMRAFIATLR